MSLERAWSIFVSVEEIANVCSKPGQRKWIDPDDQEYKEIPKLKCERVVRGIKCKILVDSTNYGLLVVLGMSTFHVI